MRLAAMTMACACALALPLPTVSAQDNPADEPALFDAAGYRIARYRSPIHTDPRPAPHLALEAALALEPERDALFIDVMPVEGGVRDPASGRWTLSEKHLTIPGALWFPETGRAPVDPTLWAALETSVRKAQAGRRNYPVVVFCRADCWMSWNAARRLAESGIDNVWWLAEGTDGWHAAGRALVEAVPVATPPLTR